MIYLLDSDTILALVTTPAPALRAKLAGLSVRPSISAISAAELLAHAARTDAPQLAAALGRALLHFDVLPFGLEEAQAFASLSGTPAGASSGLRTEQLQVVAHARLVDAILVSTSGPMRALMPTVSADWTEAGQ